MLKRIGPRFWENRPPSPEMTMKKKLMRRPANVVQRRIRCVLLRREATLNSRSTIGRNAIMPRLQLSSSHCHKPPRPEANYAARTGGGVGAGVLRRANIRL